MWTPAALAVMYGVKIGTIYSWRSLYKIGDIRKHKRKVSAKEVEAMRARHDAGEEAKTIIADFPISASHGRNILAYIKR